MSDALGTAGAVVSAQEHRLALAATIAGLSTGILDARTGVFPGPNSLAIVTGTSATAPMTVNIAAHQAATARTSAQGLYLGPTLEAATTVNIAAAPASNSRIDVVYVVQQDADASVLSPDGSTGPVWAVATGTSAASPTKPSIPVGALELATVTVQTGATTTSGGLVTIANTVLQTVARGGIPPVRSGATTAGGYVGAYRDDPTSFLQRWNGSAWGSPTPQRPYAQLKQATTQLIPISTWTTIALDAEDLDSDGQHSNTTNNSRFTCVAAGIYQVCGSVPWLNPPGTSVARVGAKLRKNGTDIASSGVYVSGHGGDLGVAATTPAVLVSLAAGDYVELQGFQEFTSTGGGLYTRITTESVSSLSAVCVRLT